MAFAQLQIVSSLADAYSKDGADALILIGNFDSIDDSALAETIQQAQITDQRVVEVVTFSFPFFFSFKVIIPPIE